jgi:hypothetical protein
MIDQKDVKKIHYKNNLATLPFWGRFHQTFLPSKKLPARRTAFGEKFAIQFHRKLNYFNSQLKFGQNSPNDIRQKRRQILRANISPNAIH